MAQLQMVVNGIAQLAQINVLGGFCDVWEFDTRATSQDLLNASTLTLRVIAEFGTTYTIPMTDVLVVHEDYDRCWFQATVNDAKAINTALALISSRVDI